jgi:hypothetical protein
MRLPLNAEDTCDPSFIRVYFIQGWKGAGMTTFPTLVRQDVVRRGEPKLVVELLPLVRVSVPEELVNVAKAGPRAPGAVPRRGTGLGSRPPAAPQRTVPIAPAQCGS